MSGAANGLASIVIIQVEDTTAAWERRPSTMKQMTLYLDPINWTTAFRQDTLVLHIDQTISSILQLQLSISLQRAMAGRVLVVAAIFLLTAADSWFIAAGGPATPTDGEVGEVGGNEYALEDRIGEQLETLEELVYEQLELQKQQLQYFQVLLQDKIFYRDCAELYKVGGVRESGVYTIKPDRLSFKVYCDMETDGGGWTVFQRRMDGSVEFYRNWMDYVRGFGDLTGEFWLGLGKIHRITELVPNAAGNELRVDLEHFEGDTAYAKYGSFAIGELTDKYRLSASGYNGTAGDSLKLHNGNQFSTRDQDNDAANTASCAQLYKGGWWYENCHYSNLNGPYLGGRHTSYADGVEWYHWTGYYYSLKFTEMKVRRKLIW